jgi:hypothetical protein
MTSNNRAKAVSGSPLSMAALLPSQADTGGRRVISSAEEASSALWFHRAAVDGSAGAIPRSGVQVLG